MKQARVCLQMRIIINRYLDARAGFVGPDYPKQKYMLHTLVNHPIGFTGIDRDWCMARKNNH